MCSSWRWHWASADSWALEEVLCLINGKNSKVSCWSVFMFVMSVCLCPSYSWVNLTNTHTKLKIFFGLFCIYLFYSKVWGQKKIHFTFIQQGCIKLIKSYIVTKKSISNKCCPFELSIHQRILNKKMDHSFHKNIKLFTALVIWNEHSALHHRNKCIKIENDDFKL